MRPVASGVGVLLLSNKWGSTPTKFFQAVERKRADERLSWRQVAAALTLSPSTFSRMSKGRRPDIDTFMKLLGWLGRPAEEFMTDPPISQDAGGRAAPDTVGDVGCSFRTDPSLRPEDAEALEQIVRVAYYASGEAHCRAGPEDTRKGSSLMRTDPRHPRHPWLTRTHCRSRLRRPSKGRSPKSLSATRAVGGRLPGSDRCGWRLSARSGCCGGKRAPTIVYRVPAHANRIAFL